MPGTFRLRSLSILVLAASSILLFAGFAPAADAPSSVPAGVRGMTNPVIVFTGGWGSFADDEIPVVVRPLAELDAPSAARLSNEYLDACPIDQPVRAGEEVAIRFAYPGPDTLEPIVPAEGIIAKAWQAIAYAPSWMSEELRDLFSRLDPATQDTLAGVILAAADPIVDEIAFTVAHTAPEVLSEPGLYEGLLVENAEYVYAFDPYLDYAEIIDHGDAATGGDYWSTVRYATAENGETTFVELPRDRYYWDIVHPKITDEFPTYIDPATGDPAAPPTGRFWREFLFTHADSGFVSLADYLAGIQVVWESNVDTQTNGAVGKITKWILDVLDFGSGLERPIQPVRIYRLHLGRCGEHADITCAAARAALIACNSASAPDEDHTWNEFYERRWVAWEPVNNYIDSGWHYEGWGKSFMGVYDWRGDGWTWTVTERYTPACTLTVQALDSLGYPVDGALVRIGKDNFIQSCWGYTDYSGLVTLILGDVNDIFMRIESSAGTWPAGSVMRRVVTAAVPDSHYTVVKNIVGVRPAIPVQPGPVVTPTWDTYGIHVVWNVDGDIGYGGNQYAQGTFAEHREGGLLDFFICDEENYALHQAGQPFFAYEIHEDAASGDVDFVFPTMSSWYAVFSGEEHIVDKTLVSGTVDLYRITPETDVASSGAPVKAAIDGNRPNPFNPTTAIDFTLPKTSRTSLVVYEVTGRLVRTLVDDVLPAGAGSATWDGRDDAGRPVAAGVYFARLEADGVRLQRKMVLVK